MAKLWFNSASRMTLALLSLVLVAPQAMAYGYEYQSQAYQQGNLIAQAGYNGDNLRHGRFDNFDNDDLTRGRFDDVDNDNLSRGRFDNFDNDDFTYGRFDGSTNLRLAAADRNARFHESRRIVSITGVLRRERGDWIVVDALTSNRYELLRIGAFENERWFRPGTQVEVTGTTRRGTSSGRFGAIPLFVRTVERVGRPGQQRITVSGLLKRSIVPGSFTVTDNTTGDKFFLIDTDRFEREIWFRPNTQVRLEGNVRRPRPNVRMDGTPLSVITMRPLGIVPPGHGQGFVSVTGVLRPTITAGGWTVTDNQTGRKFLLLNIDQFDDRPWFRAGVLVNLEGALRPNTPNIHMEGVPLAVTQMRPILVR